MWEASGMVNLSLCISKTVTDIYLKQVTHERNILFEDKSPTHSNQQLDTPHEHFCAKLLSNYKELEPELFSCTTTPYLLGRQFKIFSALGILLAIFTRTYLCFMRKKCASERRIFNSSPDFL